MASKKHRPFTDAERVEVYDLCLQGRLGTVPESKIGRLTMLYAVNPAEYGKIQQRAHHNADRTVNPLLGAYQEPEEPQT